MTASPTVTPTDAAERVAPITFVRWAVGVLVPLAVISATVVWLAARAGAVPDFTFLVVVVVYSAIFWPCFAIAARQSVAAGIGAAVLTTVVAFAIAGYPIAWGFFSAAFWLRNTMGPLWVPLPMLILAIHGGLFGLVMAAIHRLAFSRPAGSNERWLAAHVKGSAASGAMLAATTVPMAILGQVVPVAGWGALLLICGMAGVLPHLYVTWRVLTSARPNANVTAPTIGATRALLRMAAVAGLAYTAVAYAHHASYGSGPKALMWPNEWKQEAFFDVAPGRPDPSFIIEIGRERYRIDDTFMTDWVRPTGERAYFRVRFEFPLWALVAGDAAPAARGRAVDAHEVVKVKLADYPASYVATHEVVKLKLASYPADEVNTDERNYERPYRCKDDHFHGLTVCWHERESFASFSPPDTFDRRMAIRFSTRDETVYYFGDADEPDTWLACWEFNGLCNAQLGRNGNSAQLLFPWTLLRHWRGIIEGVRRTLDSYVLPQHARCRVDMSRHCPWAFQRDRHITKSY